MSIPYALTWINQTPNIINTGEFEALVGIANDNNGNVFIAYSESGTVSGGTNIGGYDIVVAKFSRSGVIQWTRQLAAINTTLTDYTLSVACDGTNFYIAHHTDGTISGGTYAGGNSDITVAKFDTNGNAVWAKQVRAMSTANVDQNPRCAADSAGNVYVAYETDGTVSGGQKIGAYDIALFKLNTSGVLQWIKEGVGLGSSFGDYNASVTVDSSSNVYVAYQVGGGTVSGGSNKGADDIAVAKFSSAGLLQWVVQPGGLNTSSNDQNPSIAADPSGNTYVTYMTEGTVSGGTFVGGDADIVVAKLNTNGQVQWTRQPAAINSTGYEQYPYIVADSNGASYITYITTDSVSSGSLTGGDDIAVLKMSTTGDIEWIAQQPGVNTDGNDRDPRISVDSLGYVNVAFITRGTVSGGQATTNNDIVVLQYAQPAVINPLHADNALAVTWAPPPLGSPFTSYNLGVTRPWSTGTGLTNANWASIKGNSSGSLLIACPYSSGSAVSLYKSTDFGASWSTISGSTYIWYTIDVSADALVIVGTTSVNQIMGRSTNAGSTYTFFASAFQPNPIMNAGVTGNGLIGISLITGYTTFCSVAKWSSGTTILTPNGDANVGENITCCASVPDATSDAIFFATINGNIKYFSNYGYDGTYYYKYLSELWITKTGVTFSGTISAMSLSSGGSRMVVVTNSGNMYIGTLSGTLQVAVTPIYNFIAAPSFMMGLAGGYKNVKLSPSGTCIVAGAYISGGLIYVGKYDGSSWNFTPIPQSLSGFGPWVGAYVNNDGLRIHMGREGGQIVNGNVYGVVTTSSTSSTISGLTNGLSYSVFLTALNSAGLGPFALTTGQPDPLPDAPTDLVATVSDRLATLSWTASWDALLPISNYIIMTINGTIYGATSGTSIVVRGLSPYTSYTFRIYAVNSAGTGYPAPFPVVLTPAPSFPNQTVPFPDCLPWVWLDASDPTTITATGNTLTAWQNKGTAASNVGSVTGTVRTGTDIISGRSVITMAPGSQMSLPSITALSSSAFAGFYVVRPTTDVKAKNTYINVFGQTTQTAPQFYLGGDSNTNSFTMNAAVSIPPYSNIGWIKQQAVMNASSSSNPSIAVDGIGNTYVAYESSGTVSGGTNIGSTDIVVFKMDSSGTVLWIKEQSSMNTTNQDSFPKIAVDMSGNSYISYYSSGTVSGGTLLGSFSSDIVVFKLSTNGQVQWIKQQAVTNTTGYDYNPNIGVDSFGNSYITYYTGGTVSGGTLFGGQDVVVFKLDTNGTIQWVKEQAIFNTTGYDQNPSINVDSVGNTYITYQSGGTVSGGTNIGSNDIVVIKMNSNGAVLWIKEQAVSNTASQDSNPAIGVDALGNSYISYYTSGTVSGGTNLGLNDIVVFKLDANGQVQWVKENTTMNTTVGDFYPAIYVDPLGNSYITYYTQGTVSGGTSLGNTDVVVFKMDTNGTVLWIKQQSVFNTTNSDQAASIVVDTAGNSYIAYSTGGTVSGGTNIGSANIVVFKIVADTTTNAVASSGSIDNQYQSIGLYSQVVNSTTQPYLEWIKQHPVLNTGSDDYDTSMATDISGNLYICYSSNGSVSGGINNGGGDVVVAKLDTNGQLLWIKEHAVTSTISDDWHAVIAVDTNGNSYVSYYAVSGTVSGGTNIGDVNDIIVFKLDANGNVLWTRQQAFMNTPYPDYYPSIGIDQYANIYVSMYTNGTVSGGANLGGADLAVFKMDTNGTLLWIKEQVGMSTPATDYYPSLAVDAYGNSYISYYTAGTVSGGANLDNNNDIVILKLDTYGNLIWTNQIAPINTTSEQREVYITCDSNGNIYGCYKSSNTLSGGTFMGGGSDIVVFKMDTNGQLQWLKQNPNTNTIYGDFSPRISVDSAGNSYITYYTSAPVSGGALNGDYDIVVYKLDTNGNVLWIKQELAMNTIAADLYPSIAIDRNGNVFVGYNTTDTISGGSNSGLTDIVVFKLNPGGTNYSRLNGTDITLKPNVPITNINTSSALSYTLNGSAYNSGIQYAELIVFSGAVSQTLAYKIEGYLAWKWGLQAALPVTHPYSIQNCAATLTAFIRPRSFTTVFAGNVAGTSGGADGTGTAATFNGLHGIVMDSNNNIFVSENSGCRIRKITPDAIVTTFAGAGYAATINGTGTSAVFNFSTYLTIDKNTDTIYVSEARCIRKITKDAVVTVLTGNPNSNGDTDGTLGTAKYNPSGIAINRAGTTIYLSDNANKIRKISLTTDTVTTLAGPSQGSSTSGDAIGIGSDALFNGPSGIAVDSNENVYVCDMNNNKIKKITPDGLVTVFAGASTSGVADGIGTDARFNKPHGICVDSSDNIYVCDQSNQRIRRISPSGIVTTVVGYGPSRSATSGSETGVDTLSTMINPRNCCVGPDGSIYFTETNRVRAASSGQHRQVGTYLGGFNSPDGIVIDKNGTLFVADWQNNKIQKIDQHGFRTVLAGSGAGWADGQGTGMNFYQPRGVVLDNYDNLFVSDPYNHNIRKVTKAGVVTTFAGPTGAFNQFGYTDGTGLAARFNYPLPMYVDKANNLYVGDTDNNRLRKITPQRVVTTVAGNGTNTLTDGIGTNAGFKHITGLYIDKYDNVLLSDEIQIRKMTSENFAVVPFVGGSQTGNTDGFRGASKFNNPYGITMDNDNNIYVCDTQNHLIRKITPAGEVTWFSGQGVPGIDNGVNAAYYNPSALCFDSNNNCMYITDQYYGVLRVIKVIPQTPVSFANNPINATFNTPNGTIQFQGLLDLR